MCVGSRSGAYAPSGSKTLRQFSHVAGATGGHAWTPDGFGARENVGNRFHNWLPLHSKFSSIHLCTSFSPDCDDVDTDMFGSCSQSAGEERARAVYILEAQLKASVGTHIDLTLLHSCTFVSLVTELLCALDHSSNVFALAQVASQNRLPF